MTARRTRRCPCRRSQEVLLDAETSTLEIPCPYSPSPHLDHGPYLYLSAVVLVLNLCLLDYVRLPFQSWLHADARTLYLYFICFVSTCTLYLSCVHGCESGVLYFVLRGVPVALLTQRVTAASLLLLHLGIDLREKEPNQLRDRIFANDVDGPLLLVPTHGSMASIRISSRAARRSLKLHSHRSPPATPCSSLTPPTASIRHASTSSDAPSATASDGSAQGSQRTNPAPGPPKPNSPFTIFDRPVKVLQRDRAARRVDPDDGSPGSASRMTDYVRMASAENISERILDIRRNYDTIVEIGSGPGYLRHFLDQAGTGVKKIIMCDSSREMLYRDEHLDGQFPFEIERIVLNEEELPFEPDSFDCIVSSGSLHWTNDLPGALIQIRQALKPDGVFVGSMYGGDTLLELRTSLQLAEQER